MADDLTRPYVGYRSAGRRPESQQDRAGAREAPLAALRGFASGVLGAPGDIESLVRMIPGLERSPTLSDLVRGTQPDATFLPTSEDVERRLPGRAVSQGSAAGRAFTGAGQLAGGFYAGPGSPLRAVAALPGAVKKAGRDFVMAAGVPSSNVIKPKGGNWRSGSIEDAIDRFKFTTLNEQGLAARLAERVGPQEVAEYAAYNAAKVAANAWLDTKLAKYMRNEMGTPEDPIRALAERGVMPYELPPMYTYDQRSLMEGRTQAGFPAQGLATTPLGRQWEAAADYAIAPDTAGELAANRFVLESNPWLAKLDPNTPVYSAGRYGTGQMGFMHVMDQLIDAMNPETTLPAALRLTPEKLQKVSVPQAFELTDKINKYRLEEEAARRLKLSRNAATVLHKDYPDSPYAWVELKKPQGAVEFSDDAMRRSMAERGMDPEEIEAALFDPQMRANIADEMASDAGPLADALKYEGDTMGHCVGGYCPDVLEGKSRIFSLRSAKGEPHVTVEVKPERGSPYDYWYGQRAHLGNQDPEVQEFLKWVQENRPDGGLDSMYEQWASATGREMPQVPQSIVQIKGKANRAPKEEYLPYVQDFVRSQKWGSVGDIQNTGLTRIDPASDLGMNIRAAGVEVPPFVTQEELTGLLDRYGRTTLPSSPPDRGALGRAVDEGLDFEPDVGHPANNPARPRYNDGDLEEFARGGAVTRPDTNDYDAATIDALAQRLAEEIYG